MPVKAPRVCGHCNGTHKSGERCPTVKAMDRQRKARHDTKRPSARKRGYDVNWDKARAEYLQVYNSCRRCGQQASVVDHIKPHKGDKKLFWDRTNWQALCSHCHNSAKQAEERRTTRGK